MGCGIYDKKRQHSPCGIGIIMITYERICEKLGFQFDDRSRYDNLPDYEDDSISNPLDILTSEEINWALDFLYKKYNIRRAA
jgi:hypothetical protein